VSHHTSMTNPFVQSPSSHEVFRQRETAFHTRFAACTALASRSSPPTHHTTLRVMAEAVKLTCEHDLHDGKQSVTLRAGISFGRSSYRRLKIFSPEVTVQVFAEKKVPGHSAYDTPSVPTKAPLLLHEPISCRSLRDLFRALSDGWFPSLRFGSHKCGGLKQAISINRRKTTARAHVEVNKKRHSTSIDPKCKSTFR
jgi:hypothetical protein